MSFKQKDLINGAITILLQRLKQQRDEGQADQFFMTSEVMQLFLLESLSDFEEKEDSDKLFKQEAVCDFIEKEGEKKAVVVGERLSKMMRDRLIEVLAQSEKVTIN